MLQGPSRRGSCNSSVEEWPSSRMVNLYAFPFRRIEGRDTHSMLYASMNRFNGPRMLRRAEMSRGDIEDFLDRHEEIPLEYPNWMLGDLMGVAHSSHMPFVIPSDGRSDTWSSDDDEPAPPPYHGAKLYLSSLYQHALSPRLWAAFAGQGEVPPRQVPVLEHGGNTFRDEPRTPGPWWVRAKGFICNSCCRPLMSQSFARKLNLALTPLDGTLTGAIIELADRPSNGSNQLSTQPHRAQYHAIGQAAIKVDFSTDTTSPRRAMVTFIVFGDLILPRGSLVDFVVNGAFARDFPSWVEEALLHDDVSPAYRHGLSSPSRCEVPRAANASAHTSLEPPAQRRLPARELALQTTDQLEHFNPEVPIKGEDTSSSRDRDELTGSTLVRASPLPTWQTTFSPIFGAFAWRTTPQGLSANPTVTEPAVLERWGSTAKEILTNWYSTRGVPPRESVTTRRVFLDSAAGPSDALPHERVVVTILPGQFETLPGCPPPEKVVACVSGRNEHNFISQEWLCNCGVLQLGVDCPPAPAHYLEGSRFPDEDALFGKKMHLDGAVSLPVLIYGCTPKRVKFCLFDDASHHAEHMILNIEEFPEYKPDLRPACNTPENKSGW